MHDHEIVLPFAPCHGGRQRRMSRLLLACGLALGSAVVLAQNTAPPASAESPAAAPAVAPVGPKPKPSAPPTELKLPPVDEGGKDPSWVAFRNSLLAALGRGDRTMLLGIVDRNITNGLEAPRGAAEFRKLWELDGKDDRVLRNLSSALNLGSAWHTPDKKNKNARILCAPYVPIKWPLDDVDPYDSGAIVVKEALVKGAPSHASPTLGTLSFDIIGVRDWDVADAENQLKQRWVKVNHRGQDGYVPEEHIRSAIEHRACFAKTGNTWRMVEYVVGIEFLGGD